MRDKEKLILVYKLVKDSKYLLKEHNLWFK